MPFIAPTQPPPAWHTSPGQQAPLRAPQFSHVRGPFAGFAQASPVVQVALAQQGWPEPPQVSHVETCPPSPAAVWQARPAVQALAPPPNPPPQHSAPSVPQATHIPIAQRACDAVHIPPPPPQQGCPIAPHAVPALLHDPFMHIPSAPPPQVVPLAWQVLATQQPPPLQVLAAQHAWPSPPHAGAPAPPAPFAPPVPFVPADPVALPAVPVPPGETGLDPPQPRTVTSTTLQIEAERMEDTDRSLMGPPRAQFFP